ncbi:hypothetical protein C4J81_13965 [Deltaproteobacteria bacterium Smac51]|nr:hypothetical protein C4J81_13965 [Deltaproteobacteria bacterium Smac51]
MKDINDMTDNTANHAPELETEEQLAIAKHKEEIKVEWFGVDGALILLYVALACFYGYGMLNRVDFIIGYFAPGVAITITSAVFLKYCTEVFAFATKRKKPESSSKQN